MRKAKIVEIPSPVSLSDCADMACWLGQYHPRALQACISENKRARWECMAHISFAIGPKIISIPKLIVAYNKYRAERERSK